MRLKEWVERSICIFADSPWPPAEVRWLPQCLSAGLGAVEMPQPLSPTQAFSHPLVAQLDPPTSVPSPSALDKEKKM